MIYYTYYWIENIFFFEASNVFNRVSATIGSIFILVLSAYHIARLAKSREVPYFYTPAQFWIISGLLFNSVLNLAILLIWIEA